MDLVLTYTETKPASSVQVQGAVQKGHPSEAYRVVQTEPSSAEGPLVQLDKEAEPNTGSGAAATPVAGKKRAATQEPELCVELADLVGDEALLHSWQQVRGKE